MAGGRVRVGRVLLLGALAGAALTGCSRTSPYQDYTAPGAVPFGPSSTVGPTQLTGLAASPGAGGPVGAVGPSGTERADTLTVGRPMTPAERRARENCALGVVQNGCKYYSDWSLQLQGVDPDR